jgi:hypothetical protein
MEYITLSVSNDYKMLWQMPMLSARPFQRAYKMSKVPLVQAAEAVRVELLRFALLPDRVRIDRATFASLLRRRKSAANANSLQPVLRLGGLEPRSPTACERFF